MGRYNEGARMPIECVSLRPGALFSFRHKEKLNNLYFELFSRCLLNILYSHIDHFSPFKAWWEKLNEVALINHLTTLCLGSWQRI